jgi:hypothetical protein
MKRQTAARPEPGGGFFLNEQLRNRQADPTRGQRSPRAATFNFKCHSRFIEIFVHHP